MLPPLTIVSAGSSDLGPKMVISMTPKRALRFSAAVTLFGASMHYLVSGRKEADINKMITGAVLALASLLFL
jgi:hypothetical protein